MRKCRVKRLLVDATNPRVYCLPKETPVFGSFIRESSVNQEQVCDVQGTLGPWRKVKIEELGCDQELSDEPKSSELNCRQRPFKALSNQVTQTREESVIASLVDLKAVSLIDHIEKEGLRPLKDVNQSEVTMQMGN